MLTKNLFEMSLASITDNIIFSCVIFNHCLKKIENTYTHIDQQKYYTQLPSYPVTQF